jgi:DNA-binding CsgD family transcriptional regulator
MGGMSWKTCIEQLIGSIPFPTLVFDDSNKVILSNAIKSQVFNWTPLPIPGQSLFDLFPIEKASLLHEAFLNAVELKKPYTHSMGLMPSDKSAELTVEMIPVFNNDNTTWNLIFVVKEQPSLEFKTGMEKPATADVSQAMRGNTRRAGEVEEAKAALKFLLREGAAELSALKKEMYNRFANQILPFVESLKSTKLSAEQLSYAELLEANARELTEPFGRRIADPVFKLSPAETKVALLVREGKTNREIAKILKVSKSTILTHRHHVRVKLGLKKKKLNLRSYLSSLGQRPSLFTKSSPEKDEEIFSPSPDYN